MGKNILRAISSDLQSCCTIFPGMKSRLSLVKRNFTKFNRNREFEEPQELWGSGEQKSGCCVGFQH